ncbi:hypothetical protein NPIL_573071, partial [Nephila pilipes]
FTVPLEGPGIEDWVAGFLPRLGFSSGSWQKAVAYVPEEEE